MQQECLIKLSKVLETFSKIFEISYFRTLSILTNSCKIETLFASDLGMAVTHPFSIGQQITIGMTSMC